MKTLNKLSLRYLLKHPWQFGLSILGIAMGVSIVVSIDIANHSSAKAFDLSMNAVAGKATHQIIGTSEGIEDSYYTYLRIEKDIKKISPVIETYVKTLDTTEKVYKLIGVDFFAERPFRNYLNKSLYSLDGNLKDFLTKPNSVILTRQSANDLDLTINDTLNVLINGREKELVIIGFINEDEQNRSAIENLIISDIATAQNLTGKENKFDYIDVIIENDEEENELKSLLPAGYELQKSGSRSQTAEQMLEAFNINLTSLSLLALIVGLFLIYNTMTFSVVQRKVLIGTLRSIGVTSKEISRLILRESFVIGLIGTAIGFMLAYFISKFLLIYISQSINDLYYVVSVREIHFSLFIFIKGITIGILTTVLAAIKPAREASGIKPRLTMIRSEQESVLLQKIKKRSFSGLLITAVGVIVLLYPSKSIWFSYLGILPIIIGFALLTPLIIILIEKLFSPLYKKLFGITGKMASRSILQSLSRTHVAIAALGLAVAATVGVGTMINSFRSTVINWLEARLNADVFISAPNLVSRRNDAVLEKEILEKIKNVKGVGDINFYREIELYQEGRRYHIIASGLSERSYSGFEFKETASNNVWQSFKEGDLLLSEPFAYKNNLEPGDSLSLKTDYGMKTFNIAGVYYDYASDQGLVTIHYDHFIKHWNTEGISGISVFVNDVNQIEKVKQDIQALDAGGQELFIRTYKFLRDSSIEIFDRTFLIAEVLQILSVIVAFVGILSSLMSLQLERKRELGILRANGFVPFQLFKMVNLQTILMGLTAGIIALPLGNLLAAILVFIINKRSFGWTMQFEILPSIMFEAVIVSILAAILAGIYPGIKMSRTSPVEALRSE